MHFVLEQLKSGQVLTRRYALYHGLALIADLISLAATAVFSFSLADIGLDPLGLAAPASCADSSFTCSNPHNQLFLSAGLLASLLLAAKTILNLKCLLFR